MAVTKIKTIKQACDSLAATKLPSWNELPDIEIYKDQLLSLIDRYLGDLPGTDDKLVTGSMINNYVKHNVMPAPVNKRYTREHIACLIVIALLKTILPISTLGELIRTEVEAASYEEMYTSFVSNFDAAVLQTSTTFVVKNLPSLSTDSAIIKAALRSRTEQALALELMELRDGDEGGELLLPEVTSDEEV